MKEEDFEGTLILEELASRGLLEAFYDAVDADDFARIVALLRTVDIDEEEIAHVVNKITAGND